MGYQDDGSRFGGEPRNLPYIEHARYRIPRRRTRQKRTGLKKALSGLSVMSGLMAMLAAFNVLEGSGFQHNLKCVLIGAAMMLVALTVNSAAIHEGATQAALGLWSGWVLFSLMIFTGCGLYAFTISGLLQTPVDYRRLSEHGDAMAGALSSVETAAHDRQSRAAALEVVRSSLEASEASEIESAATSGQKTGRGRVARHIGDAVKETRDLLSQLQQGASASTERIDAARSLLIAYRDRYAEGGTGLRTSLQEI